MLIESGHNILSISFFYCSKDSKVHRLDQTVVCIDLRSNHKTNFLSEILRTSFKFESNIFFLFLVKEHLPLSQ